MRAGQGVIQGDGFQRGGLGSRQSVFGGSASPKAKQGIRVSQTAVCQSVAGIFGDGLLETIDAPVQCVFGTLVKIIPSLQIIFVGFWIRRGRSGQGGWRTDGDIDFPCNGLRNLLLQGENIPELTVVFLRPNVFVGGAANQLYRDTNPVSLAYNRSFHQGVHLQFFSNLRRGNVGILEAHHRGAGDDAQAADHGQAPDKLLSHAVGKIVLCRVAGEVLQRQHCQGFEACVHRLLGACAAMQRPDNRQQRDKGNSSQQQPKAEENSLFRGCRRAQTRLGGRGDCLLLGARIPIAEGHRGGEPISSADHGFYKTRLLRVISQRRPDFADGGIDAMVNIEEDILAPEPLGDFLAGYQLATAFEQQEEQLHGEFLQPQLALAPLEPVAGLVERELAEMELLGRKSPAQARTWVGGMMPQN